MVGAGRARLCPDSRKQVDEHVTHLGTERHEGAAGHDECAPIGATLIAKISLGVRGACHPMPKFLECLKAQ
jgi:hypothetical protein